MEIPMIGQVVSHYKILEHLGGGGMGVVYKAQDLKLGRLVALKFLLPDLTRDPEAKQRFIHEAQAASALEHPNICSVHEIGDYDGQTFIVMGYYEGETLKMKIERGPLPIDEAVGITIQVAEGLATAHKAGIVHRDVKPANIILTKDGTVKILDFGLAKVVGRTLLTKSGTTLGTAAYMSPEQARGESADQRTDIWSLGVTFFEMLTGMRPFESEYEQALIYSILNEHPKPIRELRPEVPEAIEKICRRALAQDPRDRYQTVPDLIADLESFKAGTQLSQQTRKVLRKKRGLFYAGLAAIALTAATVVFYHTPDRGTSTDRVAVLPFQYLSKDSTREYLADGMTMEVIARLQQISSLSVPPLRATIQYRGSRASHAEIAHELSAKALVVGSILWVNNRVRVLAAVVDPSTDRSLWSETYDGSLEDILDLQSKLARAVVHAVRVEVTKDEAALLARSRRVDPDVYSYTLKGKATVEYAMSEKQIHQGIGLVRKAVDQDPTYAPAWAGLSQALWMLAGTGFEYVTPSDVCTKAVTAADKALELDETLADAHLARAVVAWDGEWDIASSRRHFERALQLQPGYAAAHNLYAQMLCGQPLFLLDEARQHLDRARELDPLSPWNDINSIAWWLGDGQLELAIKEGTRIFKVNSTLAAIPWMMGFAQLRLGQSGQAAFEFETALKMQSPERPAPYLAALGLAYGLAGRRTDALKILSEMDSVSQNRYMSPYFMAAVCSGLGRMDEAYRLLEQALEQRTPWLVISTRNDPLSMALRRDPRWKPFVDRLRQLVRLPSGTPNPYL